MDSSHKVRLARAVVSMLRPLIRLLIRHEFTHEDLTQLIRQTYVEIAYDHFSIPDVDMTISRVAVLTGLSRKEVVRFRDGLNNNEALLKLKPNRAQRVVHGWLSDSEFLDEQSNPLDLPLSNKVNGIQHASFLALVKRYSGDITIGAVLEELNLVGVTKQPDEQTVQLVNSAYVPRTDELEQIRVVATSVGDLFDTALHNVESNSRKKRFQRQVVYSDISEEFVEEFKKLTAEKATPVIQELNAHLSKRRKESAKKPKSTHTRLGFGIYYIEGPSEPPENVTRGIIEPHSKK